MLMVLTRPVRTVVLVVATAAYVSRPWSCGYVLSGFSPPDTVPYANFDYHGVGVITGWALAIVFAVPTFLLATHVLSSANRGKNAAVTPFGRAVTLGSAVVALALGAPTFTQIAYLLGLPLKVS